VRRQAAEQLHGHDVACRVAATEGSHTEGAIPSFHQFVRVHTIVFPALAAVVSSASRV